MGPGGEANAAVLARDAAEEPQMFKLQKPEDLVRAERAPQKLRDRLVRDPAPQQQLEEAAEKRSHCAPLRLTKRSAGKTKSRIVHPSDVTDSDSQTSFEFCCVGLYSQQTFLDLVFGIRVLRGVFAMCGLVCVKEVRSCQRFTYLAQIYRPRSCVFCYPEQFKKLQLYCPLGERCLL